MEHRAELLETLEEIKSYMKAIKEDSEFLREFIKKYELSETQKEQYVVKAQVNTHAVDEYVIYDTYNEEYMTNRDGSTKTWKTFEDAKAVADSLYALKEENRVDPSNNMGRKREEENIPRRM